MTERTKPWVLSRGLPLSLFWFFYFGGQGIFFPYYALYLRENAALSGTQVGLVLAMLPLMGIFAQPFWGQVADRTGARTKVLASVAAAAALSYTVLATANGFVQLLLFTALLALFAHAVVPIGVSVCFGALGEHAPVRFGFVRVWGTIGFLLSVVAFPQALHFLQPILGLARTAAGPSEPGLQLMFPATTALVMIAALVALRLPREGGVTIRASAGDWRLLIRNKPVLRLLLFTFGAFLCLQGPIALFPVYVRSLGGDMDTIGRMWVLMLLLEIPLVAFSGAGLARVGARGLLAIGAAAGGLRWAICGFSDNLSLIYASQLLHGVVVTGLFIGGPLYLEAIVPERLRSTAQTLLSMVTFCAAGILSNVTSGWLIEHVGIATPYALGGIGAIVLGCAVPWILPAPEKAPETPPGRWEDGVSG